LNLLKLLLGLEVDEVSHCVVSIEFVLGLANAVDLKPPAVIVLIEEDDPSRNEVHLIDLGDLRAFLLTLVEGLVGGQQVDVLLHVLLFLGQQVLEDKVDALTEQHRVLLFVVVQDAQQPALVVLVHRLVDYLLALTRHPKGMLKTWLLTVLAHAVTEYLLVQLNCTGNRVVVAKVVTVCLL
jgi:hypothetical protein